jgi:hypothetical protein
MTWIKSDLNAVIQLQVPIRGVGGKRKVVVLADNCELNGEVKSY